MDASVLEDLGLTESGIALYQALLREGEGTASSLAKKADVGRRLAYDRMQSLVDRGLVSYIDKENKRVYKPSSPERLRELVEDRREELNELDSRLDSLLPSLLKQFNANGEGRDVKILEGKSGIKSLFNDQLREEDDTILIIGSTVESEKILEHFLPSWRKKREEHGVKIKGVFEHEMRGMVGKHAPTDARFLPEGHESNVSISIYGDKVGIIFWIQEPLVIMIDDPSAAASFTSYFDLLWEAAKP